MGWRRPIFSEKRGGPKENFTMIGGAITEFSSKFIVDEKLVMNYIEHLSQLQSVNEICKQEQRKEFSKFEPSKMYIAMTGKHL